MGHSSNSAKAKSYNVKGRKLNDGVVMVMVMVMAMVTGQSNRSQKCQLVSNQQTAKPLSQLPRCAKQRESLARSKPHLKSTCRRKSFSAPFCNLLFRSDIVRLEEEEESTEKVVQGLSRWTRIWRKCDGFVDRVDMPSTCSKVLRRLRFHNHFINTLA